MPPLEARLWERAPLTPLTDVLTGMGTAWKEKLWELGGSGGMLPQNFFPQKIKVYAIWGYPEVIFMETWQLMSCSFTLKKPQRVWDWAHANAHSNQRTQRCALVQMLLCVEVVLQGCNTMAGIIFMTHLCCKQCTMLLQRHRLSETMCWCVPFSPPQKLLLPPPLISTPTSTHWHSCCHQTFRHDWQLKRQTWWIFQNS